MALPVSVFGGSIEDYVELVEDAEIDNLYILTGMKILDLYELLSSNEYSIQTLGAGSVSLSRIDYQKEEAKEIISSMLKGLGKKVDYLSMIKNYGKPDESAVKMNLQPYLGERDWFHSIPEDMDLQTNIGISGRLENIYQTSFPPEKRMKDIHSGMTEIISYLKNDFDIVIIGGVMRDRPDLGKLRVNHYVGREAA